MPHKNASSPNGFVLKNNKHMVTWHLNRAIWIAVDARFTAQLTMYIAMKSSLQKFP